MKILSYLIAIIVTAVGAWFSYDTKSKFTELNGKRLELVGNNTIREETIKEVEAKMKDKTEGSEAARDAAEVALAETKAELQTSEDNLAPVKREQKKWEDKIAGQAGELKEVQARIAEVKLAFAEVNLEPEEVPSVVTELEEDVKESGVKLDELGELASSAESRVESATADLQGVRKRISDRAQRLKGNALEGFVTGVNHEWGIAVVSVPAKMPVDSSTKLMVRRGTSYIGNLKISSIEGSEIIADIDYKSMSQGLVLQSGDTVFLAKPLTN